MKRLRDAGITPARSLGKVLALSLTLFPPAVFTVAGSARAGLVPSITPQVAVLNKYLWRGALLTDGPVMQPSVNLALGGLQLNAWGNMDLDRANNRPGRLDEIDYTAGYTFGLGLAGITLGGIAYTYPQHAFPASMELTGSVSLSLPGAPTLGLNRDVKESQGTYLSLSGQHSIPSGPLDLSAAVSVGWGDNHHNACNYCVDGSGLTDASLNLTRDLPLTPAITLEPSLGFSRLLDSRLRNRAEHAQNLSFGITLKGGF